MPQEKVWLFLGDSITQGAKHTDGARDYTQLFAEHLRFERRQSHHVIVNAAVDGMTAVEGADHAGRWLERLRPDFVVVLFGTNDAARGSVPTFESAMETIVGATVAARARVAVGTPPPVIGAAGGRERELPAFVAAARGISARHRIPLVDHAAVWETHDRAALLDDDGIHPTASGHRVLARTLIESLAGWVGTT